MSDEIFTIPQIKAAAKEYGYKMGDCLGPDHEKVCGSNKVNQKIADWLDRTVVPMMKRPEAIPGVYFIQLYPDSRKKSKAAIFPIQVGKPSNGQQNNVPVIIHMPASKEKMVNQPLAENSHLSLDTYLATQRELTEARGKIKELEVENIHLKAKVAQMEEAEEQHLSEQSTNDIVSQAMPVLGSFFENQKMNRMLKFLELSTSNPHLGQFAQFFMPGTNGNGQQQFQQVANNMNAEQQEMQKLIGEADEFIDTLDDEDAARVDAVLGKWKRSGNKDMRVFFGMLAEECPDIHKQLEAHLMGGEGE